MASRRTSKRKGSSKSKSANAIGGALRNFTRVGLGSQSGTGSKRNRRAASRNEGAPSESRNQASDQVKNVTNFRSYVKYLSQNLENAVQNTKTAEAKSAVLFSGRVLSLLVGKNLLKAEAWSKVPIAARHRIRKYATDFVEHVADVLVAENDDKKFNFWIAKTSSMAQKLRSVASWIPEDPVSGLIGIKKSFAAKINAQNTAAQSSREALRAKEKLNEDERKFLEKNVLITKSIEAVEPKDITEAQIVVGDFVSNLQSALKGNWPIKTSQGAIPLIEYVTREAFGEYKAGGAQTYFLDHVAKILGAHVREATSPKGNTGWYLLVDTPVKVAKLSKQISDVARATQQSIFYSAPPQGQPAPSPASPSSPQVVVSLPSTTTQPQVERQQPPAGQSIVGKARRVGRIVGNIAGVGALGYAAYKGGQSLLGGDSDKDQGPREVTPFDIFGPILPPQSSRSMDTPAARMRLEILARTMPEVAASAAYGRPVARGSVVIGPPVGGYEERIQELLGMLS